MLRTRQHFALPLKYHLPPASRRGMGRHRAALPVVALHKSGRPAHMRKPSLIPRHALRYPEPPPRDKTEYTADDVADASVLVRATVMLRNLRPRAPVNPARAPVLMLLAGVR